MIIRLRYMIYRRRENSVERLDQAYLNDIVRKAMTGSSNSFAELYAACAERFYIYLRHLSDDRETVWELMQSSVVMILKGISSLQNPELFLPWALRQCLRCAMERADTEDEEMIRLLSLPLSESQMAVMKYRQNMSNSLIADLLNVSRSMVKRYLKSADRHLGISAGKRSTVSVTESIPFVHTEKADPVRLVQTLSHAFDICGWKANTVPMEALSSYAVYRKERFSLQKRITVGAGILFLALPMLFILPEYDVSSVDLGSRGLPVYTISVKSFLPVRRVTARIRSHSLPVYEADAKIFTVEPIRNADMTIEVELINRQNTHTVYPVTAVDAKGPVLTESRTENGEVILYVKDEGIGVNYRGVYARDISGTIIKPLRYDSETGEIVFEYPQISSDVYIPDHIGNTLHIAFTLKQRSR